MTTRRKKRSGWTRRNYIEHWTKVILTLAMRDEPLPDREPLAYAIVLAHRVSMRLAHEIAGDVLRTIEKAADA